jgi:hypothetical protein
MSRAPETGNLSPGTVDRGQQIRKPSGIKVSDFFHPELPTDPLILSRISAVVDRIVDYEGIKSNSFPKQVF